RFRRLSLIHAAGGGRFCEAAVIHYRVVEAEAAGEIVAVKAVSGQDAAGDIAAQAALTDDIHRLAPVQLAQPLPQLVNRDVDEAVNVSPGKLSRRADVQQRYTAVPGESVRVRQMPLLQDAMGDVLDHETGHVDRVLGGGVGRR